MVVIGVRLYQGIRLEICGGKRSKKVRLANISNKSLYNMTHSLLRENLTTLPLKRGKTEASNLSGLCIQNYIPPIIDLKEGKCEKVFYAEEIRKKNCLTQIA